LAWVGGGYDEADIKAWQSHGQALPDSECGLTMMDTGYLGVVF